MKLLPNIKTVKEVPILEDMGAEIEFDPQAEELNPRDNFDDDEAAEYVINQYNNGNAAAWFNAKVTVTYKGFDATDYLGACSYKSFKEFTSEENGYYQDMINQCIDEINRVVESINFGVQRRWDIRRAKRIIAKYDLYIVGSNKLETL